MNMPVYRTSDAGNHDIYGCDGCLVPLCELTEWRKGSQTYRYDRRASYTQWSWSKGVLSTRVHRPGLLKFNQMVKTTTQVGHSSTELATLTATSHNLAHVTRDSNFRIIERFKTLLFTLHIVHKCPCSMFCVTFWPVERSVDNFFDRSKSAYFIIFFYLL